MLHVAPLIHDDILDQDILRRNELTANIKWASETPFWSEMRWRRFRFI
jgi:geranylgeranyl pyrophosphate synthase